jgi:VIT1/CCC1 family predicted Fe2+/Mn2+ transporter
VRELHRVQRIGWLRAAVLGANDGIVSTASLMVGVAAAHVSTGNIVLTGVAGLVAGAMSMAAGEYVSVHSQADTETADIAMERNELQMDPVAELKELQAIYMARGVTADVALQVAQQLMQHDALGAHAHDELGITDIAKARPVQAALTSAASFAVGAALPLLVTVAAPKDALITWIALSSLVCLALMGVLAAKVSGVNMLISAWRVTFWGALAIAVTAGVGTLFGVAA